MEEGRAERGEEKDERGGAEHRDGVEATRAGRCREDEPRGTGRCRRGEEDGEEHGYTALGGSVTRSAGPSYAGTRTAIRAGETPSG